MNHLQPSLCAGFGQKRSRLNRNHFLEKIAANDFLRVYSEASADFHQEATPDAVFFTESDGFLDPGLKYIFPTGVFRCRKYMLCPKIVSFGDAVEFLRHLHWRA